MTKPSTGMGRILKVSIQTLGCKVNQSESAFMEGLLRNNNYEVVKQSENPDICIINTCTVTAKSDYQSRQLIRKSIRSGARVIATGCYAQLRPRELSEIEGLTTIIGNSGKEKIVSVLRAISNTNGQKNYVDKCAVAVSSPELPLLTQPYHSTRSRAFLKIQDGCNFSCAYCAIPLARGKSRSLNKDVLLKTVDKLVSDGYREVVVTGIHIGAYGRDRSPRITLLELLENIAADYPGIRIRLSSIEPQEFNTGFLDLIERGSLCPHLHIPLQSGSNTILRKMNRGYTTEFYEQLINTIITGNPDISIGTDLIVGFPGESDNDFNDTVKLIKRSPLSYIHVFPYSRRPDTRASLFAGQVSEKIKKERVNTVIEISNNHKLSYMKRALGKTLNVIVEDNKSINGYFRAISENYLKVFVRTSEIHAKKIIKVKVISLTDDGLVAEPLI